MYVYPYTFTYVLVCTLLYVRIGPLKRYVRSEEGKGVPKTVYENVQGEEGLFREHTYSHVILKRLLLPKHPK